jgi:hypothetical protein
MPAASKTAPAKKTAATPVKAKTPAKPVLAKPLKKPVVAAKAAPQAAKAAKIEKTEKADKADKARKPKLVRDSFTIPKAEYTVLETLKQRAAKAGTPVKKSELLRAGIKALSAMDDKLLLAALGAVPALKTGRPAKA